MRPVNPRSHGSFPARTALLGILAGLGVVVAILVTLVVSGQLPFFHWKIDHRGMVPVPICARPIPAYAMVTRDYLWDLKENDWAVHWFRSKEDVPPGVLTDLGKIRGRVMAREKPAAFLFTESDFLPVGTRPGLAAGVPLGKRAMTIEAGKLNGIYGLQLGDSFSLVASVPLDKLGSFGGADWNRLAVSALTVPTQPATSRDARAKQQTETRMLAQAAVIVSPVTSRNKPIVSSSLTQGTTTRMVPVQEIVIAIGEDEVAPVTDALGLGLEMTCVAHSGRPEDKVAHVAPAGMIAVPVSGRAIAAYSLIMPEDLLDPATRQQRTVLMSAVEVKQRGIVAESLTMTGRVLARDKSRGQIFTEDDLLPAGTPPGLAGGIPPGKRALTLDAGKVAGARALRLGDHFDLMASAAIDWGKGNGQSGSLRFMGSALGGSSGAALQKQAAVRAVVQDGVVVVPVASPTMVAIETASGDTKQAGQEMVVAVAAEEVPRVAEALALGLEMTSVVRSGNPHESAHATPTPDENPLAHVHAIESIVGQKRETLVFPIPTPGKAGT
jgi:hypothetical protein